MTAAAHFTTLAVCSLLHEPADPCSATRPYRGHPVLQTTLGRLGACEHVGGVAVVCWDDQAESAGRCAAWTGAAVIPHGPRQPLPQVEAVAAAGRWHDGWRGGLLQTCATDLGFFAPTVLALAKAVGAEAIVPVDPASALLDADLLDGLIAHAAARPQCDHVFTPAAPGLSGTVLRLALLESLAQAKAHPGARLHYVPDAPTCDALSGENCFHAPPGAQRTLHDFRLASGRTVRWAESLGDLADLPAQQLVARLGPPVAPPSPRELALEPTTRRHARPIWQQPVAQAELSPDALLPLVADALAGCDDLRLTLGGRGDPLLWPALLAFLDDARTLGVPALHVETDLLGVDAARLDALAAAGVDVVSINIPAMSADTYQQMMGADRLGEALANLGRLMLARQQTGRLVPILVPRFVKCRANLHEMEAWYDQWLRCVGNAALCGPDDAHHFGAPPTGVEAARMIRSERRPFELRVRADGTLTDHHNHHLGHLGQTSLADAWRAANPPDRAAA